MLKAHKPYDRLGWFIVAWIGLGLGEPSLQAEPPITKETVLRAWKDRQDRVKTARIEWIDRETIPKGGTSSYLAHGATPKMVEERLGIPAGSIIPPQDTTHDVASSVCLDGNKTRLEREDRQWSPKEKAFVIKPVVSVFDGNLGKTLRIVGGTRGQGSVREGITGYMDGPYMRPVALAYRPFFRGVSPIDPDPLSLTERKVIVKGSTWLELERHFGQTVHRIWVDPSLNYAPVRRLIQEQDRITDKLDITYRKEPNGECLVETWENLLFRNGKLVKANRIRVTKCEINKPIKEEEFELQFPQGTNVRDYTKRQVNWIPGMGSGEMKGSFLSWPLLVIFAVGLLAGTWFVWRRVSLRTRPA